MCIRDRDRAGLSCREAAIPGSSDTNSCAAAGLCCPCEAVRPHFHSLGLVGVGFRAGAPFDTLHNLFALWSAVYVNFSEQAHFAGE